MKKYSPSEFAKLAGVSYHTLLRWEKQGRLIPNYTESRRRYYTDQHLEQYLKIKSQTFSETETEKKVLFRKII